MATLIGNAPATAPRGALTLTRIFNAPRDLVFRAWTDPVHLAQWWGPSMFTNPICEVDLKPGGVLRIVMRGPDGTDYGMVGIFQEIVESELLVFTNNAVDEQGNHLLEGLTKVMFEEHGEKTKLTVETSVVGIAPQAAQMIQGMEAGWTQSLVCLEEFIDRKADPLIIERTFEAPVDLVWRAITVNEEIRQWSFADSDFKPEVGFEFHFTGKNEGVEYHHICVVTDVIPLKRLTYSWRYDGYEGDSVVDFELYAVGNTTKLKLTHRGLETFPSLPAFARANFAAGWTSLIGFLKDHVEKQTVQ